jgi:hypothetical protein
MPAIIIITISDYDCLQTEDYYMAADLHKIKTDIWELSRI